MIKAWIYDYLRQIVTLCVSEGASKGFEVLHAVNGKMNSEPGVFEVTSHD
jgi:hypothetical protein